MKTPLDEATDLLRAGRRRGRTVDLTPAGDSETQVFGFILWITALAIGGIAAYFRNHG